jgi:hypothetical protein
MSKNFENLNKENFDNNLEKQIKEYVEQLNELKKSVEKS